MFAFGVTVGLAEGIIDDWQCRIKVVLFDSLGLPTEAIIIFTHIILTSLFKISLKIQI